MKRLHFSPSFPRPAEEEIRRLESELDEARSAIIELMPDEVAQTLGSYIHCETREQTHGWEGDVADRIIELAKVLPHKHVYDQDRAYCPLCGQGSSSPYTEGFSVPEGLSRHLTGYGNVRQCVVMAAATRLARDYWHRQFHESEEKERSEKQALLAQRKKTETLYRVRPDEEPGLIDGGRSYLERARTPDELAWAEQRLSELGFEMTVEGNVKAYICRRDGFVIYADPRTYGEIMFRVFKEPVPKHSRVSRIRLEPWFRLKDAWKNDIGGKFEARLAEATKLKSVS
jgi:hypothetical protein